jgi:hypothetical protein
VNADAHRLARVLDAIQARTELPGLRVLDLACRTGFFATALATAGADVLGIEGRPENLDQTEPSAARYEQADVRTLSAARHGVHDVTLCLGILYHLAAEDAVGLLAAMREVTESFAVIDTHIGAPQETALVGGIPYAGNWYHEPDGPWSSIGNSRSFWFAPEAFVTAARLTGWSTVEAIPGAAWPGEADDRRWWVIS